MNRFDEFTQISYEISMSIGISLNLQEMLRDVALVMLRKLNCVAFVVFRKQQDGKNFSFEEVYTTLKGFLENEEYGALAKALPDPVGEGELENLRQWRLKSISTGFVRQYFQGS